MRVDDGIDEPALGGDPRDRHVEVVILDEAFRIACASGAFGSGKRFISNCAAPSAPITAMRAVGQAKFRSAVSCLDPITA